MEWKAELVFGYSIDKIWLMTKTNSPDQWYQTMSTEQNFLPSGLIQIYKTKSKIYQTKTTKLNLQNQIYQAECLKCKDPNLFNQSYKSKSIQSILANQIQISHI